MESLARLRASLVAPVFALVAAVATAQSVPGRPPALARSLFAQSAVQVIEQDFPSRDISFLLYDARTGVLLTSRWEERDQPILLGSLLKPFTALAYAETHGFRFPHYQCGGAATGCWQPKPHGNLDLVSAVSESCNSYFRELASHVTGAQVAPVANEFGIEMPEPQLTGADLMGLGAQWKVSPSRMAHAYLELNHRRNHPGVREIIAGMKLSAESGTGAAVDRALRPTRALVKTGTAPCTHRPAAPGDGFVVALVPADQPELLLFVRVHGVPGAVAAKTAGRMLRDLEE